MDAQIFVTLLVCLFPTEPQNRVCNAVTLRESFPTVDACEAGWVDAVGRWAGDTPAADFTAKIMGCGPEPGGSPEDVPFPKMPQRHSHPALPPGMGAPVWELQGQEIADKGITFTWSEVTPIKGAGPIGMVQRLATHEGMVAKVALVVPALGALAFAAFDCQKHTFAIQEVGEIEEADGKLTVGEMEPPKAAHAAEFTPIREADEHWLAVEAAACGGLI